MLLLESGSLVVARAEPDRYSPARALPRSPDRPHGRPLRLPGKLYARDSRQWITPGVAPGEMIPESGTAPNPGIRTSAGPGLGS